MHPFSILVVDDERDFTETLSNRLTMRKIDTSTAQSGEEAVALVKERDFDVVIMDILMPGGMDGIEALREIKKLKPRTEVILLTGHASVENSIEGMKQGAFDYLLKPVKLAELLKKIAEALERKDAQDQKIRGATIRKLLDQK